MSENDLLPGVSRTAFISSNQLGRCIAIVLVVIAHVPRVIPDFQFLRAISFAKVGVAIFTFYSGFLLQYRYGQGRWGGSETAKWLLRRMLRIFPAYWFCLSWCLALSNLRRQPHQEWHVVLINFLGLELFTDSPGITAGFVDAYWYVSFILGCYLLFLCVRRNRHKGLLTVAVLCLVACTYGVTYSNNRAFLAALAVPLFFAGMWMGDVASSGNTVRVPGFICWTVALVCIGLSGLAYKCLAQVPSRFRSADCLVGFAGLTLGSLGVVGAIAYTDGWLQRRIFPLRSACVFVGDLSYEIYLFHLPCFFILVSLRSLHSGFALAVYAGAVLGAAYLFSRTSGEPINRLRRSL